MRPASRPPRSRAARSNLPTIGTFATLVGGGLREALTRGRTDQLFDAADTDKSGAVPRHKTPRSLPAPVAPAARLLPSNLSVVGASAGDITWDEFIIHFGKHRPLVGARSCAAAPA